MANGLKKTLINIIKIIQKFIIYLLSLQRWLHIENKYYSAKAIFHRIRWESMISGEGDYKIDDGWISHYARKFIDDFPQHSGFFKTRDRQNSYHKN